MTLMINSYIQFYIVVIRKQLKGIVIDSSAVVKSSKPTPTQRTLKSEMNTLLR